MLRKLLKAGIEILRGNQDKTGLPLDPPLPKVIYIIINNTCNLRCKMCDVGQKNEESQFYKVMISQGRQMDLNILKKLVDQVQSFAPTLAVTSTEPLLYKDLFLFVKYAKSRKLPIQITTNGFLLPRYAEDIVVGGVDSLWVSLDGPRNVHNEIRGNPLSYEKAFEGIVLVTKAKEYYKSNMPININYAISNHNYNFLIDFLVGIKDIEVSTISFSHMNYVTADMAGKHNFLYGSYCQATQSSVTAADPVKVDVSLLGKQITEIKLRKWPFSISFAPDVEGKKLLDFYRNPEVVIGNDICHAPFNIAQLASNGDWIVTTRCFPISMGNIFEEGFRTTWYGDKYRQFRTWVKEKGLSPACTRCCGAL